MLSYQHGYHCGNFADVFKHLVLINILEYLIIKDKPLFYIETHAGRGGYSLSNYQALKTMEYKNGVEIIWEHQANLSEDFKSYLNILLKYNTSKQLGYYPGSPLFALNTLRKMDKKVFCEHHPIEFDFLNKLLTSYHNVVVSKEDGFKKLNSLLPPQEKRACIFIDPSYEIKSDYEFIPKMIQLSFKKFKTGTYCIWYPLLKHPYHLKFAEQLKNIHPQKFLCIEFNSGFQTFNMSACGVWIINPPYTLKEKLEKILNILCQLFNPGYSSYTLKFSNE